VRARTSNYLQNFISSVSLAVEGQLENIRKTPVATRPEGWFSMLALTAIVAGLAWQFGGFRVLLNELPVFLQGGALVLPRVEHMFPVCAAAIVGMMAVAIGSAFVVGLLVGDRTGEHAVAKELANMTPGNKLAGMLLIVFLEEVFARGFFLGVLPQVPFLSGATAFYVLFLLGNGLWAAMHLSNFQDPDDRSLLRVVPQFLGGIILTYIFVKYGFFTTVMVHLGYNTLLLSMYKRDAVTKMDFVMTAYAGVIALIAIHYMNKPFTDLVQWFQPGGSNFHIANWTTWDYFLADMYVTMSLSCLFGLLAFDRPLTLYRKDMEPVALFFKLVIAAVVATAMIFGCYWILRVFTMSMVIRMLIVGVLFACLEIGRSGSGMGRTFWCEVPCVMVTLCVMEAVGFWPAVGILLVENLLELPMRIVRAEQQELSELSAI